jgi:DNA-directed RNA polymerase subunit beta'
MIITKEAGTLRFNNLRCLFGETEFLALDNNGTISIHAKDGTEIDRHSIQKNTIILLEDGSSINQSQPFARFDPLEIPVIQEKHGRMQYLGMRSHLQNENPELASAPITPENVIILGDTEKVRQLLFRK